MPSSESESSTTSQTDSGSGGETTEVPDSESPERQDSPERPTSKTPELQESFSLLYNVGMIMRQQISAHERPKISWPPEVKDFDIDIAERMVPIELYNLMAWITGLSDEPVLDMFVEVPRNFHCKSLSILQDVIMISRKGRDFSPKAYSLGLTVKHWTGSSKLIELLSRLGHCESMRWKRL